MSSDQDTRHRTVAPHPPHDPVSLHPVATEIIAEWPAGTFIENLAPASDRSAWLVTIPSHHRVDKVHGGRHEVLADLPHPPTGIVTHQTGALVISGPMGHEGWRLVRIRDHGYEVVCDVPGLLSGNGMAWVDQRVLLADSLLGLVLSMDPARGTVGVAGPRTAHQDGPLITPAWRQRHCRGPWVGLPNQHRTRAPATLPHRQHRSG